MEEVRANADKEAAAREERVVAQSDMRDEVASWVARHAKANKSFSLSAKRKPVGDLRRMLRGLHEIMPGVPAELFAGVRASTPPGDVKRSYRRAVVLCHPDKHHNAGEDVKARAAAVFAALKSALDSFVAAGGR